MDLDDFPELRAVFGLAVSVFAVAVSGVLNAYVWVFLLGLLIGALLVGAWLLLDGREGRRSRRVRPADPPDSPLRIRVKEWGEAMDVWSKVALRVTGVILLVVGGTGALGVGINQLAG